MENDFITQLNKSKPKDVLINSYKGALMDKLTNIMLEKEPVKQNLFAKLFANKRYRVATIIGSCATILLAAGIILNGSNANPNSNVVSPTYLGGTDNIPSPGHIDPQLRSRAVSLCQVKSDGVQEVVCNAYGNDGWFVNTNGDFKAIFCLDGEVDNPRQCIYTEYEGQSRQWCQFGEFDSASGTFMECDLNSGHNGYLRIAVNGDLLGINCAKPGFPLASECSYEIKSTEALPSPSSSPSPSSATQPKMCRINSNGRNESVECKATSVSGRYETARGELKLIYCLVNGNTPSDCMYYDVNGVGRQWCRIDYSGTLVDEECDPTANSKIFLARRGDASNITCTQGGYPLATGCRRTPTIVTSPVPTVSVPVSNNCKEIISGYYSCYDSGRYGYIIGPSSIRVNYTDRNINYASYSISPNQQWMYVISDSEAQVATPSDPGENAVYMIDIKNNKLYTLFTNISLLADDKTQDWSPDGSGFTFTAGPESRPYIIPSTQYHAVVYCTTSCRVLALDAGPYPGITAEPSYFANGKIIYTNINGEKVSLGL